MFVEKRHYDACDSHPQQNKGDDAVYDFERTHVDTFA